MYTIKVRKNSERGMAQIIMVAVMAFLVLGIPITTRLVQTNQENRSKAAEDFKDETILKIDLGVCNDAVKYEQLTETSDKDNPELLCKSGKIYEFGKRVAKCGNSPDCPPPTYLWKCLGANDKVGVLCQLPEGGSLVSGPANLVKIELTKSPLNLKLTPTLRPKPTLNKDKIQLTPILTPIPIGEVSLSQNFAMDRGVRKMGSVLRNDIMIKTGGKKIKSATIVYCYTDLLKPDLNSVSGEQIDKVVSNKEIGNNCAELKVVFNNKKLSDSFYKKFHDYVISYKVTIVKYGKGKLNFDCTKSSLFDINDKKFVSFCGDSASFDLQDPATRLLTPTPQSISKDSFLYFNPLVHTYEVGTTFEVTVGANSKSVKTIGIDVLGKYDSSVIELVSIRKSPLMVFGDKGNCNRMMATNFLRFECYPNSKLQPMAVNGDLAVLTFNAKTPGIAKIQFDCSSDGIGTRIDSQDYKNMVDCNKNLSATITITNKSLPVVNGVCGEIEYSRLSEDSGKKIPTLLCKSGKVTNYGITPETKKYYWRCEGSNGGVSVVCATNEIINGSCGSIKFSELSQNSGVDKKDLLCKTGLMSDFNSSCVNPAEKLPCSGSKIRYSWKCKSLNDGKDVVCSVLGGGSTLVPNTGISVDPKNIELKVGQSQNLTYILTPSSSINKVKWQSSGDGKVYIERVYPKCAKGEKCAISVGTSYLKITGQKVGKVTVKLTTDTDKVAEANITISPGYTSQVITGVCGDVKYAQLSKNSDVDNKDLLCKSGILVNFKSTNMRLGSSSPNNRLEYTWTCLNVNTSGWEICTSMPGDPKLVPATDISFRIKNADRILMLNKSFQLEYMLTPINTTDKVKWTTSGTGQVKIEEGRPSCPIDKQRANACYIISPGSRFLQITALKAGIVKVKLTTDSGKSTEMNIKISKSVWGIF